MNTKIATSATSGQTRSRILRLRDLRVETPSGDPIVHNVSLDLSRGEILGLVGESGSGKTTVARALLGYTSRGAQIASGSLSVDGAEMSLDERGARRTRGGVISYVPQNPGTALNPSMRVGDAIEEMYRQHGYSDRLDVARCLERVGLPTGSDFRRRYPHQLSGGQQQRLCIAIALTCEPPIVVLDEPTTGLDVVTQSRIVDELARLRAESDVAIVYVTHDLAVVAQLADRVAVMYGGSVVEQGPTTSVLRTPRHPYTQGLLNAIPDHLQPRVLKAMPGTQPGVGRQRDGCAFAPRCALRIDACDRELPGLKTVAPDREARCLRSDEVAPARTKASVVLERQSKDASVVLRVSDLVAEYRRGTDVSVAAHDISFEIAQGRCVALVGESGSGKTTIARTIAGLHPIASGKVFLHGDALPSLASRRTKDQRRRVQIIFQNPADALHPKRKVRTSVSRSARYLRGLSRKEATGEVERLFEMVRLPSRLADRYPRELSGGELQRVGIARALAAQPDIIVCDEVTSALDVSVQAAVLELLAVLREEMGLAMLFITHDLGVVANIADEVLVLENGFVGESGSVRQLLVNPEQPYTRQLMVAAPSISEALSLHGRD